MQSAKYIYIGWTKRPDSCALKRSKTQKNLLSNNLLNFCFLKSFGVSFNMLYESNVLFNTLLAFDKIYFKSKGFIYLFDIYSYIYTWSKPTAFICTYMFLYICILLYYYIIILLYIHRYTVNNTVCNIFFVFYFQYREGNSEGKNEKYKRCEIQRKETRRLRIQKNSGKYRRVSFK